MSDFTMTDPAAAPAYTIKELLIRLDGKLDAYIAAHEHRHSAEGAIVNAATSDLASTAAGRVVKDALTAHERRLTNLEVSRNKTIGALALIGAVGVPTLLIALARLSGFLP